MQVCRICLALDRKMYPLDTNCLHLYNVITGLNDDEEDLLPKYVCWECRHYMLKYNRFKRKAVASHCVLMEMLYKDGVITESSVKVASSNRNKPTLACNEVINLTVNSEMKIMKVEYQDSPIQNTGIKMELHPDSDNVVQAGDVFINAFDAVVTTKVEFISHTTAGVEVSTKKESIDDKSEVSDDPLSDNVIQFASNARPDFIMKKKRNGKQELKEDGAKCSKKVRAKALEKYYDIDRDLFTITELSVDEQITELQRRKETENYKRSLYKCENCFKGFLDDTAFQRHMERHAESAGPLVCALCKTRYTVARYLRRHMTSHSIRINCKKCSKFSSNIFYNAYKHQKYHQGEKYECKWCKNTFSHRTTFLSHVRIKHPVDIVCAHCGKSFMNRDGLVKHLKKIHGPALPPISADGPLCARCDIRFSCQDALDTHRRVSLKHVDERDSTSHKKGDSTKDKKEDSTEGKKQRKYVRRKSPTFEPFADGPKPCEQCGEEQPSQQAYHLHFRTVHKGLTRTVFFNRRVKRHMCEVCGARCASEQLLRDHQYAHSSSKEFKCDRCGKQFKLKTYLEYHQKRFCGVRVDYPCSVCGKNFASKFNLHRHMVIHKGLEYKCELCDKVFYCPMNRKAHVDFVHNKKPRKPRKPRPNRAGRNKRPEDTQSEIQQEESQDQFCEGRMQEV